LQKGWFEQKKEELKPGFYYFENKGIIAQGFEEKPFTKEDLKQAAIFLNEYIQSHPSPQKIASIVRAGLLLPFSFAQKQMVMAGKLRKRMKYLYLMGQTKSGKTTTASLLARIWSTDNKISYASFCTEPRAATQMSQNTFILIVDEVNKELETSSVKELLKYTQEELFARTILSKTQKQINYLALAPVIMTSNSHFPRDPALLERFHIFQFRKKDKISAMARAKYEKEDFNKLWPIAQFTWAYVKKHGLRDHYVEYATEILKSLYEEASVHAEWLDWAFKDDTAETEEEQEYNKEIEFFNAILRFFQHFVKPKEGTPYPKVVWEALNSGQFGRWLWVDDKFFLYVSKDFLTELKKFGCEIRDLEDLTELMGWEKKQKRYKNNIRVWIVETTVMDFFFRLGYVKKLLTTWEFEEWLAGRLKVKEEDEIIEETKEVEEDKKIEDIDPFNDLPF
jgi:hypothetical protein